MKKLIAFVNTTEAWGGGEKWHLDVAEYLHDKGYEVLLFVSADSQLKKKAIQKELPYEEISVSNLSFLNPFKIKRIARRIRELNITTVLLNGPADLKCVGIAAQRAGVERIIYRRGSAIPIKNTVLNRYLLSKVCTDILCNSQETKRTVLSIKEGLIDGKKIKVIYNPINTEEYIRQLDKTVQESRSVFTIGNLGRIVEQKAQYFLLDLAEELLRRDLNFKILIGGEGRLREELEELVRLKNLNNVVDLQGYIEHSAQFIARLDLFILTSKWEGFGYVLSEAMLAELPCIAFNLSSNPEIIENERNGYLIEPFDIQHMAEKVEVLMNNEVLSNEMGTYARKSIVSRFNKKRIMQEMESWLFSL